MSLSIHYLEYGRHVARLHRRRPVVRTRPRAIPLAMITMRKSIHGFPFVSYMSMGLRLAALLAAGAPLLVFISSLSSCVSDVMSVCNHTYVYVWIYENGVKVKIAP